MPQRAHGTNDSNLLTIWGDSSTALGTRASPGLDGTGISIRSFLLSGSEAFRNIVTNSTGYATILGTRVARVRPEIANLKVSATLGDPQVTGDVSTTFLPPSIQSHFSIFRPVQLYLGPCKA